MSEILGEARILVVPDTSLFRAQLEEKLAFARKPIVVPVVAGAAGGRNAQAELAGVQAVTAERRKSLAVTAAAARQQSQLDRGIASTTLSQFGLRGATLAASASFIAGAAATTILSKALRSSVDATENLRVQNERLRATVGDLIATDVDRWAKGLAVSFGLAQDQAVQFVATLTGLFRNFGFGARAATSMSERLVKLAADMAAFKGQGTTTTEALTALQRGLAGNARFLRTFNVFIDQSRVAQEALNETGKKQVSNLTRQELVTARYNLILRDTANQTGAFAARSGELSNQTTILRANMRNLEIAIGGPLVKVLTRAAEDANILLFRLQELGKLKPIIVPVKVVFDLGKGGGGGITGFVKSAIQTEILSAIPVFGPQIVIGRALLNLIHDLGPAAQDAGNQLTGFARDSGDATSAQDALRASLDSTTSSLKNLGQESARAGDRLLRLQAQGAGPGVQLGAAQAQLAADQAILAQARAQPVGTGRATAIRQAERQVIADLATIRGLRGQITSAEQQAATDAQQARDKIQRARDAQNQAFLDSFGGREQAAQNRIALAQASGNIARQQAADRNFVRILRDEIAAIRKRIARLNLHGANLKAAIAEIKAKQQEIFNERLEIARLTTEAAQQQVSTTQQILQINIQIAQATGNKAAEERADKAYIAFLERRIKKAKGDRLKQKQLQLELAQTRASLKALEAEKKKTDNAAQDLFFSFLQAQQGFAANLLGNLIPGGKTGGLVGNISPDASTPPALRQVSGGFEEARGALSSRSKIAGAPTGPSSGQASTTNELLRRILRTLEHLNTRTNHPEAARQRQTMNAAMDGVHGN